MKRKRVVAGILTGLVLLALAACQKPVAPVYQGVENIRVLKLDGSESLVSANVKFYNPNPFSLQLKRAEMDILLNDKLADHYLLDSTVNIPSADSFYIPVAVRINLNSILNNALQAFFSNQIKVTVDGRVKLKRGALTVNRPFHYEGAQKLDELLKSIR